MNFKKYHVSRNLFDINATPTKQSQSTIVTVDGQTITISGAWYIYYEIDVVPNTDYYVTWIIDYTEIEGRGTIAILTTSGQTIYQQSSAPFSFNSGENQRIRLYIYSGNNAPTTVIISNIMLNTGSTALPYEPYSSEVWHDTPYYVHNTSTDTITTLPAVLYPTDTTATVGLKGQTLQSSVPSPDSPVMPNGTGDRTGNLFDKTNILSGYEIVNNQIVPNSAWGVSGYIPIEQGKYYIATNTGSPVLEYETIGGTAVRSGKSITTGVYTPSENARFIRINFNLANLNNIMLNSGSTALPYEPYGYFIEIEVS